MAAHLQRPLSPSFGLPRQGGQDLLSVAGAMLDPLLAAACLLAAHALFGRVLDGDSLLLAALTFALLYPGESPFRCETRGLWRRLLHSWALIAVLLLILGLMTGGLQRFEPALLATWVLTAPTLQALVHGITPYWLPCLAGLRREHQAIVIGANPLGQALARSLAHDPMASVRVTAFFDDRAPQRIGDALSPPLSGNIDATADYARTHRVDHIYIALPMASQPRILRLLDQLRDTTASIYFLPDIFLYDLIQARLDMVAGLPVVAVCETPFHGTPGLLKRVSDVLLALIAIILTGPLMLLIAAAIKLSSPGPVLFRQRRYGLDGAEIIVWKFRSMSVQQDGANVPQATRHDARVTSLGRLLRRTSLDELPQFFNVLQGRMSVIGPRPHAVAHNEAYRKLIKGYMIRHKVKPGITGWAQVNGARGETETIEKMQRRIHFDLEYLRNWSLRLDALILAKTIRQAICGDQNAY